MGEPEQPKESHEPEDPQDSKIQANGQVQIVGDDGQQINQGTHTEHVFEASPP
jgi:hypothetical protein